MTFLYPLHTVFFHKRPKNFPLGTMSHLVRSAKQSFKVSILNFQDCVMVCSHRPTPQLIPRLLKWFCVELCGRVHTTKKHIPTQIPIGLCTHFVGNCIGFHFGVNGLLGLRTFLGRTPFWVLQFLWHFSLLCMYKCAQQVVSTLPSMKLKIMHKTFSQSCSIQTLYCVK